MAKSSRSKWKKMHRRQRAQAEASNTVKRIKQLHKKLELTVKGGISAVPPQEPETRFHFLNPELDPRVPNTRKDLNNNYRAELNHVQYDYTKPLRLAPPTTNLYGKSDLDAPHPMTVTFETIDADAPLAGHALTKADMERLAQRQSAQAAAEEALAAAGTAEDEAEDEDGPEEYVFGMTDAAPRRARAGKSASAKKEKGAVAPKAKTAAAAAAGGVSSSSSTAALAAEEDGMGAAAAAASKISSMQLMRKKNGTTVSAGGASKMKKVGQPGGAAGTRVVSSGGRAAQQKTGNSKNRK